MTVGAHRDAVERRGFLVRADRVQVTAERHPLGDDPQRQREHQRIDRRHRNAEDGKTVDIDEALRQLSDDLTPAGVPERERVEDRAGAERGDERVDLRDLDEQSVDQAGEAAAQHDEKARERPGNVVLHLES